LAETPHLKKISYKRKLLVKSYLCMYVFIYLFTFVFLGPHLQHMEIPRVGVKSELQLLAYTTATATAPLDP